MKKKLLSMLLVFTMLLSLVPAMGITASAATVNTAYVDAAGVAQTPVEAQPVLSSEEAVTWGEAGQTKWYVVTDTVSITNKVTVKGAVNLILMDDKTVSVMPAQGTGDGADAIYVENNSSLTIYAQSAGTGKLIASRFIVELFAF